MSCPCVVPQWHHQTRGLLVSIQSGSGVARRGYYSQAMCQPPAFPVPGSRGDWLLPVVMIQRLAFVFLLVVLASVSRSVQGTFLSLRLCACCSRVWEAEKSLTEQRRTS